MRGKVAFFARVPHWTPVGSVLEDTVDLWYSPKRLPHFPGLLAMVDPSTRRVIFATEFGEGLGILPHDVKRLLDSSVAYCLAVMFPFFRGPLREKVTESEYAFWWAKKWTEERYLMRHLVTESNHAFWWAETWTEERHLMRDRVTDSFYAYLWAKMWPEEHHLMRHLVTAPGDVANWNKTFPDDQINLFG